MPVLKSLMSLFDADATPRPVPLSTQLSELVTSAVFPPPAVPQITRLVLVDATSGLDLYELGAAAVIDLGKTGRSLNIRAEANEATGCVQFVLDGKVVNVESFAPFAAFGDSAQGYNPWTPPVGNHILSVIPYADATGKGVAGPSATTALTVSLPVAPPPPPVQNGGKDLLVRKTDDLSDVMAQWSPGRTVFLENGGVWNEPLVVSGPGTVVMPAGAGPRPLIVADTGVMFTKPNAGTHIKGIDFQGRAGTRGSGVSIVTNRVLDATIEDCTFRFFKESLVVQCPKMDLADPKDFHQRLMIFRCALMSSSGPSERDGQGVYAQNVYGLNLVESLVANCGLRRLYQGKTRADIYCHGLYDQHGNRNTVIRRNLFMNCESYGSQSRGSLADSHVADDGKDPGPLVSGNVYLDCALALMVNGPRGTVEGNLIQPGHFHWPTWHHGQGGIDAHVGSGHIDGNLRIAPTVAADKARGDWAAPFLNVQPRQRIQGWEWDKKVSPTVTVNNWDRPGVQVDFGDILATVKLGTDVPAAVDAMQARARKAAGVV